MTRRKSYMDDGSLGINLPPEQQRWTGTRFIYPCPDCQADLEDEGFSLWCPSCNRPVPYDIMTPDPDDERDRMIDEREAQHDRR